MCKVPVSRTKTSRSGGNWKTWCGRYEFGSGVETHRWTTNRWRKKKNAVTWTQWLSTFSRGRQRCFLFFGLSYFPECMRQLKRSHLRIGAGKSQARPSLHLGALHPCAQKQVGAPPSVDSLSCRLPPQLPISVFIWGQLKAQLGWGNENILLVGPSVYSRNDKTFSAINHASLLNSTLSYSLLESDSLAEVKPLANAFLCLLHI